MKVEVGKQYLFKTSESNRNVIGKCHTVTFKPHMYIMQFRHNDRDEYALFNQDLELLTGVGSQEQSMVFVGELKQIKFEFWSSLNPAIEWLELEYKAVHIAGLYCYSTFEVKSSLGENLTEGISDIIGMERAFPEFDATHHPYGTYRIHRPYGTYRFHRSGVQHV